MFRCLTFCLLLATSLCANTGKPEHMRDHFFAEVWENQDGSYSFRVVLEDYIDGVDHIFMFENPEHSMSCPCIFLDK